MVEVRNVGSELFETRVAYQFLPERPAVDGPAFLAEIATASEPVVLRGQTAAWPTVGAARQGDHALIAHLTRFDGGQPLDVMIGPPAIHGRFFYADSALNSFNFHRQKVALGPLLAELDRLAAADLHDSPPALYANSATAADHAPGWNEAHPLGLPIDAQARLWIGNAVSVATHFDTSRNLAVVAAGRRRFTLFPPDQFANVYVGPLDVTPAGQPISLVDPDAPDLDRFPRFAEAIAAGLTADLAPGDALYIPPLWWHHVRALDRVNVLANYWWDHASGAAYTALIHAILAARDLPDAERDAFRDWFDHLVFSPHAPAAAEHIPVSARSVLGAPGEERRRRVTTFLLRMLQRD